MIRNPHEHCRREYNPKSMHLLPRFAPLMSVIPAKAGIHCYGRPRRLNREAINRIRYVGWRAARVLIQRDVLLPEACCLSLLPTHELRAGTSAPALCVTSVECEALLRSSP